MATSEQNRIRRENGRRVAQAVNDGRIAEHRATHWLTELNRDPAGARRVLASLSPGIPGSRSVSPVNVNPVQQGLDPGMPPAPVPQDRPTRPIALGGGLIQMEAQLIGGKPREQWTEQEGRDWFHWSLGPRFRKGLRPPPEPQSYIPTESVQKTTDAGWV